MAIKGRSRKTSLGEILTYVEARIEEATGFDAEVVYPSQSDADDPKHKPSDIFVVVSALDDFDVVQSSSGGIPDLMELVRGMAMVTVWCRLATDEVGHEGQLLKVGLIPNFEQVWRALNNPMFDPVDEDGDFILAEPTRLAKFRVYGRTKYDGWGKIRGWFELLWDQDLSALSTQPRTVTKKPSTSVVVPWTFPVTDGDSISAVNAWTATPSGLTIATPAIVVPATATARISAGTKGVKYLMNCRVTTTGGDVFEDERTLVVY